MVHGGDAPAPRSPLFGKRIAVIGDSYVANHKRPVEETWHCRLAKKYHMDYSNYGKNGNTLVFEREKKWGEPILRRLEKMERGADYVIVIAGHNDAGCIARMPEADRPGAVARFREGLAKVVEALKRNHPGAKILFVSPWNVQRPGFAEVLAAEREILPKLGVGFYDAAALSGIDPHDKTGAKARLWQGKNDTAHLTYEGHTIMLAKMEEWGIANGDWGCGPSTADDIARIEAGGELEAAEEAVAAPPDMKLVLLIGQSNMAGRAKPDECDLAPVQGVYKLDRRGMWVAGKCPYHFDKSVAAVGPIDDFAKLYLADHPGESLGVVPCAVGGSGMASWRTNGGKNLEKAIERARIASANGKFIAILWHQGETDAARYPAEKLLATYPGQVAAMVEKLRSELGDDSIPFIAGEIGRWMRPDGDHAARINPAINAIPGRLAHSGVASSEGLTNQDRHHFDRASQRVLAARYYEIFKQL